MFFARNFKDAPEVWNMFQTKAALDEYMDQRGGTYDIREGNEFNPAWIKEISNVIRTETDWTPGIIEDIAMMINMGDYDDARQALRENKQITIERFVAMCVKYHWLTDVHLRRFFQLTDC